MKTFLIAASSICGRISPVGMGSGEDRAFLESTRSGTDCSLLGANSLRDSDPEMRTTSGNLPPDRTRCLITASGKIPIDGKKIFLHPPEPIVFTHHRHTAALRRQLGARAEVIGLSVSERHGNLSVSSALRHLENRGVQSVLIEGGGQLNYAALQEGCVDEILLTVTPFLIGNHNRATLADGPFDLGHPYLPLELLDSRLSTTGELFLRYRIQKEDTHG